MSWEAKLNVLIGVLLVVNIYLTYERIQSSDRLNATFTALKVRFEKHDAP
jgi:hypothetical protein